MVDEQFEVTATAAPPAAVVKEALERQRRSDSNEPLEAFLRDHIEIDLEWILPVGLESDDMLRQA